MFVAFTVFIVAKYIQDGITTQVHSIFKKGLEKSKNKDQNKNKPQVSTASFGNFDPNDLDPEEKDKFEKQYEKFKKQDGSNRHECEPSQSPQWENLKSYKGGYKFNGQHNKDRLYYRWDGGHKDIEVYDSKARYLGSIDPVDGKMYRLGDMKECKILSRLIK